LNRSLLSFQLGVMNLNLTIQDMIVLNYQNKFGDYQTRTKIDCTHLKLGLMYT